MDRPQGFLPYGRQLIEEDDVAAVVEVLHSDYLTTGPRVRAFEEALAGKVGARFAVSCSSGTAALHMAALALGLAGRDSVVVPAVTFVATANAVRFVGAECAFADVDPETGLMDEVALRTALERVGGRAKAVFPVHLNGQCVDMEMVGRVAAERDLRVIEDSSHALGAASQTTDGNAIPVGACAQSDMAVFSFHPVKTVAMGEGGAVTTNDEVLFERLITLRNHGIVHAPEAFENGDLAFDGQGRVHPWYYEMPEPGFNYRASELHCALGLSQLRKLERFIERRRGLVKRYEERLRDLGGAVRPVARVEGCRPAWHLMAVIIDFVALDRDRDSVMRGLRDRGIGTQVHYLPVHHQPYYRRRYGTLDLPGADGYYSRVLSLPLFVGMTEDDVDRVVQSLRAVLGLR